MIFVCLLVQIFFRKASWIKTVVNELKKNKKIDSAFSVHSFYNMFGTKIKKKFIKVSKWMKSYTSRQVGQKLYREDTGLASATRSIFWRKGKRIGKNVKFIVNEDSFTGIDIHSKKIFIWQKWL